MGKTVTSAAFRTLTVTTALETGIRARVTEIENVVVAPTTGEETHVVADNAGPTWG